MKLVTKYECPYCYKIYNSYNQAFTCARKCVELDDVKEINWCDECHNLAIDCKCERTEEELEEESRHRLYMAGTHPNQRRLI